MNIPPLNVAVSALCFAADGNPLIRRAYGIRLDSDVVCEDSVDRRIFDIDISLPISLLAVPGRTSALIGGGELKLSGRHPLTLLKQIFRSVFIQERDEKITAGLVVKIPGIDDLVPARLRRMVYIYIFYSHRFRMFPQMERSAFGTVTDISATEYENIRL